MVIESEIKFSVPDTATLEAVGALDEIAGFAVLPQGLKAHTDTYFDTAGHTLFHGKAVFRLREKNDAKILTFKSQAPDSAPNDRIHRRIEIECATTVTPDDIIAGAAAGLPPFEALTGQFGSLSLTVSMAAENRRRVFQLVRDNFPRFELVLDDVIFSGPGGKRRILEIEIESLGGSDSDLETIGAVLAGRFTLSPAGPSKYILGMGLVGNCV